MKDEDFEKVYRKLSDKFKQFKNQNNYRTQEIKCCQTCKYSDQAYIDDELVCEKDGIYDLTVNTVNELDICDAYEKIVRDK